MEKHFHRHRKNYNDPGHAHELTFSCYREFKFLQSPRTRRWLADSITEGREKLIFDLWAYVFMPEHVHLIIHPRQAEYDMGEIRQAIKSPVGLLAVEYLKKHAPHWLPKITRRRGSRDERLFWKSGGGYDRNVTEPATLLKMIAYLHLNPVRRGFVTSAIDWEWSSAAWFECGREGPLLVDPIPPQWLSVDNR